MTTFQEYILHPEMACATIFYHQLSFLATVPISNHVTSYLAFATLRLAELYVRSKRSWFVFFTRNMTQSLDSRNNNGLGYDIIWKNFLHYRLTFRIFCYFTDYQSLCDDHPAGSEGRKCRYRTQRIQRLTDLCDASQICTYSQI